MRVALAGTDRLDRYLRRPSLSRFVRQSRHSTEVGVRVWSLKMKVKVSWPKTLHTRRKSKRKVRVKQSIQKDWRRSTKNPKANTEERAASTTSQSL